MCAGIIQAVGEAMAFAQAEGLPLDRLIELLGKGAGSSWYFVNRAPFMAHNSYPAGFRVRLHAKDLRICREMAARHGAQLPVVETTLAQYAQLIVQGFGDEDISAIYRLKSALFPPAAKTGVISPLRIATRKSQLALWQAAHVATLLRQAHPGLEIELVPMVTQGDRIQDRPLAAIGGKGLFIKELEVALEQQRADMAVHSMKDLPGELPPGLLIAAVLERADPLDALIAAKAARLEDLPPAARVGTSSLRRRAQLLAARPDLRIEPLRGNVDSRLRRFDAGELDAMVLACAGLIRLGLESRIAARLDPKVCLPAVAQGVIGIECRASDQRALGLLSALNHGTTRTAMDAERAFAQRLGGSCQSPIAAHAWIEGEQLVLEGLVAEPDGSRLLRDRQSGGIGGPAALGALLAERMLAAGAGPLLERLRT